MAGHLLRRLALAVTLGLGLSAAAGAKAATETRIANWVERRPLGPSASSNRWVTARDARRNRVQAHCAAAAR